MKRLPHSHAGLVALALSFALSGCAPIVLAPSALPEAARRHDPSLSPAGVDLQLQVGVPAREWWRLLQDSELDALVQEATLKNPGVRAAIAAVTSARAMVTAAERERLPQGRLTADAQMQRPAAADADPFDLGSGRPPERRLATLMQGVSWEVDLFGRIGTAAGVASRQLDMAQAQAHATQAALQAEVVRHYIALRLQQQTEGVLRAELQAAAERVVLLSAREQAGLADRREVLAAQAVQAEVQTLHSLARHEGQVHLGALAALVGQSPRQPGEALRQLARTGDLPAVPASSALLQPRDLLARRPDVAWADAQLRARVGETVLADRAHLPRLALNLGVGVSAPFGDLGLSPALRYSAGPALTLDWLDSGRHRARAAAARAGEAAAWQQFEETVLRALQDAEASLTAWSAAQGTLAQADLTQGLAEQSFAHAKVRMGAGLEPRGQLLEHTLAATRAQRRALQARADSLLAFAQVQLALGAWQPAL